MKRHGRRPVRALALYDWNFLSCREAEEPFLFHFEYARESFAIRIMADQIKKASSLLESFPLAKDIQNCLAPILLEADRTTFTFVIEIALVIVVAGECASAARWEKRVLPAVVRHADNQRPVPNDRPEEELSV